MSLPVIVRPFDREGDCGFVIGTYGACCAYAPGMQPTYRRWVKRAAQYLALRVVDDTRWQTWVAQLHNGQLVGWIAAKDEGSFSRLLGIYVKTSFRREGISKELLRTAVPSHHELRMSVTPLGPLGKMWCERYQVEIDEARLP